VLSKEEFGSQRDEFVSPFEESNVSGIDFLIRGPRNGVCQSARLKGVEDPVLPDADHNFVTVRQAEDCSGAVRLFLQKAVPSV
jgi:hypothetical protein